MKQELNIKGVVLKEGDLVQYRGVSREFFGIHVFHAEQIDEWKSEIVPDPEDGERTIDAETALYFNKFRTGLVVGGPRHKKSRWTGQYFTYYKILVDQKLFWINLKHLYPHPLKTKKAN